MQQQAGRHALRRQRGPAPPGVELDELAREQDLGGEGLGRELAGVPDDRGRNLVDPFEQPAPDPLQPSRPLLEGQRGPRRERAPGPVDRGGDVEVWSQSALLGHFGSTPPGRVPISAWALPRNDQPRSVRQRPSQRSRTMSASARSLFVHVAGAPSGSA